MSTSSNTSQKKGENENGQEMAEGRLCEKGTYEPYERLACERVACDFLYNKKSTQNSNYKTNKTMKRA